MEPDADLYRHPMGALHLVAVAGHGLLHAQRRVAGAHGMIFMGNGRAEEGHNPIPHHLVDGALVAVHGLDHALQDRVQQLSGLLGIAVGQQLHRSLQVGKQYGDLLALALQGTAGGQDFFRQIGGHVGQRGTIQGARRWRRGRRRRAGITTPDEAASRIVVDLRVGVKQLVFEIVEGVLVEGKLPLEGTIGHPAAPLQHGQGVVEHLLKGHRRSPPPRWRVPPQRVRSAQRRHGMVSAA